METIGGEIQKMNTNITVISVLTTSLLLLSIMVSALSSVNSSPAPVSPGVHVPSVYILGAASDTAALAAALANAHFTTAIRDRPNLLEMGNYNIILMHSGWIRQNVVNYRSTIEYLLNKGGIAVTAFGSDAGNALTSISSNFLATRAAVYPGMVVQNGTAPVKAVAPTLPSDVVTYSLYTLATGWARIPTMSFIYEGNSTTSESIVSPVQDIWNTIVSYTPSWLKGITTGLTETPHSLTKNGFTFMGQIGWKSASIYFDSGALMGTHQVMVQYYQTSQVSGGYTYYWVLNYVQHWTTGHCGNFWEGCAGPEATSEHIDGITPTWPGQLLFSSGPTGSYSNQGTVSYQLTVGTTGASASVTYTPPAPGTYGWSFQGDGVAGTNTWSMSITQASHDTTYSLEPSTIYELDPTKSGGVLPLVTHNSYGAEYHLWYDDRWAPSINFDAYAYTDPTMTKSGDTSVTVRVYSCPSPDSYSRYHGLSVNKPLPNSWWNYAGLNIATQGSCVDYTTTLWLPTGSNFVEYAASAFSGNKWYATIYINGAAKASGYVDDYTHLRATFTV